MAKHQDSEILLLNQKVEKLFLHQQIQQKNKKSIEILSLKDLHLFI